jgi:tRNA (cytidine/uridine-2'-O-)-methyltransferase
MRLALFEPDIPQNTGTLIRLGACMGVPVDIIEPCGFVFSDKSLKRAGMDYLERATINRHDSWQRFLDNRAQSTTGGRLILLSTKAAQPYTDFKFHETDTLLLGRESAGVPDAVFEQADASVLIPMAEGARSLNVAIAGAMVLGEALRQAPSPQP